MNAAQNIDKAKYKMIDVSEILRKNRASRGLTTRELAERAGVSASMISSLETGKSSPTLNVLEKLANAMNIDIGEFIESAQQPQLYSMKSRKDSKAKVSKDGCYACYLLSDRSLNRRVELYAFEFSKKGKFESEGHGLGAVEFIVVEKGEMIVEVNGHRQVLTSGDAIEFRAQGTHTYIQESSRLARGTCFIYFG